MTRKPVLPASIGSRGTPQCQHAIETEAVDRLGDAGLLDLARKSAQAEQTGVAQAVDRLSLDGMLALWRPAGTN